MHVLRKNYMVIDSFTGEYRFLSNFYVSVCLPPTLEHWYQAAKTKDPIQQEIILKAKTPGKAKRLGQRADLMVGWDVIRLNIMSLLLWIKFQDTPLREKLLETGDAELIEGNRWHDNFWGSCTCEKCGNKGKNHLGRLLVELRDDVREMRRVREEV